MKFHLLQALKSLRFKPAVTAFTLLGLVGSFLILFLGVCYVEDLIHSLEGFQINNAQHSMVATLYADPYETNDMPDAIQQKLHETEGIININIVTTVMQQHVDGSQRRLLLTDETYANTFNFPVLAGRTFTATEAHTRSGVCIVERDYLMDTGLILGDCVEIDDKKFEIIGVIRTMAYTGALFLPISYIIDYQQDIKRFDIVVTTQQTDSLDSIHWSKIKTGQLQLMDGETYYHQEVGQIMNLIIVVCGIGLFVFIYAMFSVYNMAYARVLVQRKTIGIRLMLGADYLQVWFQLFFEILILSLGAILVIFSFEPLIYRIVHNTINHQFGLRPALMMIGCSFLVSAPMAYRILRKLMKTNICLLVKGESI